jgi:hypothetical protein
MVHRIQHRILVHYICCKYILEQRYRKLNWFVRNHIIDNQLQGVISCGLTVSIQLWCTEQKGPVFVTMFSPLATVMVAILAYFLFGEELHAGR